MGSRFRRFSEMIDGTPAAGILTVTEGEYQVLENDIASGRLPPDDVDLSVLSFCKFLHAMCHGEIPISAILPLDHLAFYRITIERLMDASELVPYAKQWFDETYHEAFVRALASAEDDPRLKILHLEDDPFDAELIEMALNANLAVPISITRAASEETFLTNIQKGTFDVIISDSRLPGYDTLKALEIARQTIPGTPFIFLSGNTNPRLKAETMKRGATDYLDKDELVKLSEVIGRACAGKIKIKDSNSQPH